MQFLVSISIRAPAGINVFKVSNENARTICEICWKLTIKVTKRRHDIVLVSLLLPLNILHTSFWYQLCVCRGSLMTIYIYIIYMYYIYIIYIQIFSSVLLLRVSLSAEDAKNVSWHWLFPLRGWGSLTVIFLGKIVYIFIYIYAYIYICIHVCIISVIVHQQIHFHLVLPLQFSWITFY